MTSPRKSRDPKTLRPATQLIHGGTMRSRFEERSRRNSQRHRYRGVIGQYAAVQDLRLTDRLEVGNEDVVDVVTRRSYQAGQRQAADVEIAV